MFFTLSVSQMVVEHVSSHDLEPDCVDGEVFSVVAEFFTDLASMLEYSFLVLVVDLLFLESS